MFRSAMTKPEKIGQRIPCLGEPRPSNSNSSQYELQLLGQQQPLQPGQQQPRLRSPPPARDGQDQEVLRQNQSEDYGPNCYQCEQEFDGFSYWYQQETIKRIKIKMEINKYIHPFYHLNHIREI